MGWGEPYCLLWRGWGRGRGEATEQWECNGTRANREMIYCILLGQLPFRETAATVFVATLAAVDFISRFGGTRIFFGQKVVPKSGPEPIKNFTLIFFKMGRSRPLFLFWSFLFNYNLYIKLCWCWDSNRGSLVSNNWAIPLPFRLKLRYDKNFGILIG